MSDKQSSTIVSCMDQLNTQLVRIDNCLARVTEEQVWRRVLPGSNAIGNLCIHLSGSEYQHIVSGIGGRPFIRRRSEEFSRMCGLTPQQLRENLLLVREQSAAVAGQLSESDLDREVSLYFSPEDWREMHGNAVEQAEPCVTRTIRGHLLYTLEHYGYHTGQIVLLTKWLEAGVR